MPKQSNSDTPRRTHKITHTSPTKPKQTRLPQRCSKCEDHPLRSQCQHTQTGRIYLQQLSETRQELNEAEPIGLDQGMANDHTPPEHHQSGPISGEREEQSCNQCIGRPLRKQCCHTKAGQAYLHEQEVLADLNSHVQLLSTPTHTGHPSSPIISPPSPIIDLALPRQSPVPCNDPQISVNPAWLSSTPHEHSLVHTGGTDGSSDARDALEETTRPRERSKRIRPTAANPIYGHVEDVFRGDRPHSIYRSHTLSEQINDPDKCQKYFLETINSIVAKCEDLSARTGCWLFIGAQHPTARGAPIHFASPRLRRDAGDAVNSFGGEFCTLMNQLMEARRRDTLDIRRNLEAVGIEKAELEKQITLLHTQNADRDALLRRYQEVFGDAV